MTNCIHPVINVTDAQKPVCMACDQIVIDEQLTKQLAKELAETGAK